MKRLPLALATGLTLAASITLTASTAAQTTLRADRIITGASSITWVGSPPTDDRIFVVEQTTYDIDVYTKDGAFLGKFLDLSGTAAGSGERGLLSLAFDPDYATNGHFYVYYTYGANGSRIERYTVSANPNVANAASGFTIIEQTQTQSNHNGGNIQFGPDGYLYFGWGDGGGAGDGPCNSQNGLTLLGKMIRIDVDGDDFPADPNRNYAIPADNPFLGDPNKLNEIWHLGLRNPWRWAFDPATGDMYIGDVGQDAREEVSYAPAGVGGLNFGWKIMEGTNCFGTGGCAGIPGLPTCNSPELELPIHEYNHAGLFGGPCSITGGVVYRGCAIPEEYGSYFFADVCSNDIWTFSYDPVSGKQNFQDRTSELNTFFSINSIRTFGYDANGEVLIGDSNEVFRVIAETRSFLPDGCDLSLSAGGTQSWSLDAGPAQAGAFYFIGGSLSGTAGIPSGSVVVPLTFDAYTVVTLNSPNQAPLLNTFANLDGAGTGSASFDAPGGLLPVSLAGTRAFHAFVTLDAFFSANFASNPTSINFLP